MKIEKGCAENYLITENENDKKLLIDLFNSITKGQEYCEFNTGEPEIMTIVSD